ncbi:extracellular solute-binding protein family 1 [Beutenbergia cavernae DSM 12333]|uniref:Extracellular solute-binding protein family 1 n=1 Tax=Beutenbergia cavernae (strain ATCC BAA-8 / DSM 12333 / CCUG 43141 / JCM 11478 / NBRC 16432 / NCIMB 13614 / HKI 0122) TaxID=471853 RepID=C5BZM9_BEUC1|nr:extracellular solute-binding protein [Beutenbergia cavernae]ACQ79201.1 extracellular solute-binding protein family 1 [Beutenbergia cavernae DSM 12333]
MSTSRLTRRTFMAGVAGAGAAGMLTGCVTGGGDGGGNGGEGEGGGTGEDSGDPSGPVTMQISFTEPITRDSLETVVESYEGGDVTVNAIATEQFRAQLSTYLTSSTPPDVIGWLAGSVARDYAEQGLLLDVGDLWTGDGACANFSDALRSLSSTEDGTQIFVPTSYYWWSVFYFKSAFEEWGVEPPTTWDDFIALCENLQGQGVNPLTNGTGSTPWMASGWFDYLNMRINGAPYHRELLAGEHAFTDPEVVAVMEEYRRLIPFFDPNSSSYAVQEAVTPLVQKTAGMYLVGAFITTSIPEDMLDDLDFFSVPPINPDVASAEEAPTDGYMGSANAPNVAGAKALMSYLASPEAQQEYIELSGSSNLPTSPDVDTSSFSPLVQKGLALLEETEEITQFFNRDSSDELQLTADDALTRFLDDPSDIPAILEGWQTAAERVWGS